MPGSAVRKSPDGDRSTWGADVCCASAVGVEVDADGGVLLCWNGRALPEGWRIDAMPALVLGCGYLPL
jgi:hypothetical protein